MTPEREYKHPLSRHAEAFGLTEREDLFEQVSEAHFQRLLNDTSIEVTAVSVDSNSFGEYLFVSLRKQLQGKSVVITFYSLGYHEYREVWLMTYWKWYPSEERTALPLSKDRVHETIHLRRAEIAPQVEDTTLSQRAILFSLLADLTDEDGALTELDDLDDLFGDLE